MSHVRELRRHYEASWGEASEVLRMDEGPVEDLPEDFGVLVWAPRKGRKLWTYATLGMSEGDVGAVELHMFAIEESPDLVELLYAAAHFHRSAAQLGVHHTVNFGRPWTGASACTHGLLSLPYLDGPPVERFEWNERRIQCLWLIPITPSELEFKKTEGAEALEALFEQTDFPYAYPDRHCLAPGKS